MSIISYDLHFSIVFYHITLNNLHFDHFFWWNSKFPDDFPAGTALRAQSGAVLGQRFGGCAGGEVLEAQGRLQVGWTLGFHQQYGGFPPCQVWGRMMIYQFGGFHSHGGTPSHHPNCRLGFSLINHPFAGSAWEVQQQRCGDFLKWRYPKMDGL